MDIGNLTETEIIELQYSLLEELKHKKTTNLQTISDETSSNPSYDVFIKQIFYDKNGNPEGNNAYNHRMAWFELGCPKYRELANHRKVSLPAIKKVASKFKWKEIRVEALKLGWVPKSQKFIDTSKKKVERNTSEYSRYHEKVLKRDKVCQCCGSGTLDELEVHHPLPFHKYNSLGADPNNGIVLCKDCHSEYHAKYGYKRAANPITLAQFLRDNGKSFQNKLIEDHIFDQSTVVNETRKSIIKFKWLAEGTANSLTDSQIIMYWVIRMQYGGRCTCNDLIHSNYLNAKTWDDLGQDFNVLLSRGIVYQPSENMIKIV